jgi:hypothetical protein
MNEGPRMRRLCRAAVAIVAAIGSAAAAGRDPGAKAPADPPPATGGVEVALRVSAGERVAFRGVVAGEGPSGPDGQFLYPAPNAAGFLASVLTHALISGSVQESRKSRQQEAADAVLAPYRPVLDAITHATLMQRAIAHMRSPGAKRLLAQPESHAQGWRVESVPVFSMTQDQTALVIDNAIAVFVSTTAAGPAHQYVVRVVSDPLDTQDPVAHWTGGDGEAMKESSARLVAASLDLALAAARAPVADGPPVHRTVRYYEGGVEKMERGELLAEDCGRRLVRNLRGWLMSVPMSRAGADNNAAACRSQLGMPR